MSSGGNSGGLHIMHSEGGNGGFPDFGRGSGGDGMQSGSRGVTIASKQDVGSGGSGGGNSGGQSGDGCESLYMKNNDDN
ncbi:hypothetical protein ACHQM5_016723 [Ranunculus cassubicifolius]